MIASRHSGVRAKHRGTRVLIEGCAVELAGLAALVAVFEWDSAPSVIVLALVLTIFGYGQGLAMAPLSSAVLSTVKPASAGAGSARPALLAACTLFAMSVVASAAFLTRMRRAFAG